MCMYGYYYFIVYNIVVSQTSQKLEQCTIYVLVFADVANHARPENEF